MRPHLLGDRRAISREGMAALGFALTVLLIGITGGLLMQSGERLTEGGPLLTVEADTVDAANGPDGQWLRIRHDGGDTIDVANVTINVTVPDQRKRATLTGLPTDGLEQTDYKGNHMFTLGADGVKGAALASEGDDQWSAGEVIAVRIEPRRLDLQSGDTVRVAIRYDPESRQLYSEALDVT
jgi:hypothetical protein